MIMNLEQFKTRAVTLSSFADKIYKADEMLFQNKVVTETSFHLSSEKLKCTVSIKDLNDSSKKLTDHYFTKFLPFHKETLETDKSCVLVYSYDLSQLLV